MLQVQSIFFAHLLFLDCQPRFLELVFELRHLIALDFALLESDGVKGSCLMGLG